MKTKIEELLMNGTGLLYFPYLKMIDLSFRPSIRTHGVIARGGASSPSVTSSPNVVYMHACLTGSEVGCALQMFS